MRAFYHESFVSRGPKIRAAAGMKLKNRRGFRLQPEVEPWPQPSG
jgi:hypothetical protein